MTAPDKPALLALADRVEALAGPCRETDAEIWEIVAPNEWVALVAQNRAMMPKHRPEAEKLATLAARAKAYAPRFTASLDAAMTRVPPMSLWSVCDMEEGPFAQVIRPMPCGGYINGLTSSYAATPALALTAAALRAKAAS